MINPGVAMRVTVDRQHVEAVAMHALSDAGYSDLLILPATHDGACGISLEWQEEDILIIAQYTRYGFTSAADFTKTMSSHLQVVIEDLDLSDALYVTSELVLH